MRRPFELRVACFWCRFDAFDVAPEPFQILPKSVGVALLSKQGRVQLLELVLHVHQQSFDRREAFVGKRVFGHR
jgi:hypothetical protein